MDVTALLAMAMAVVPHVAAPAARGPVRHISTCDLRHYSKSLLGARVAVSGVVSAGLDDILVESPGCNQPLILSIDNAIIDHSDVKPLWYAIYRQGYIGTVSKHITGTFVGRIGALSEWPFRQMTLEAVRDLHVELQQH